MKKMLYLILVLTFVLLAQDYATLYIYSYKNESSTTKFQLILESSKVTNFENGDRFVIKILNPDATTFVKIRNVLKGYNYEDEYTFEKGHVYFWEFESLSQFKSIDVEEGNVNIRSENLFSGDLHEIEVDLSLIPLSEQSKARIDKIEKDRIEKEKAELEKKEKEEKERIERENKIKQAELEKKEKEERERIEKQNEKEFQLSERPGNIDEPVIDDFVNKAYDLYDSTKSVSDKLNNIDKKIQELLQLEDIVGNPTNKIKKEAKKIEKTVTSIKNQCGELIELSQNVLKNATKLKFTKVASATKNVKSAIEATNAALQTSKKLIEDLPLIMSKIVDFEKTNNIVSTETEDDLSESENDNFGNNSLGNKPLIITVNESDVMNLNPEFGQIVFTKDTQKLLFFDGNKFKKIILDDWK